ncbi:SLC13 family permease [Streptomyces sp. MZ04]|uniref:SLC13 family permease n=1 Tax=Streptomyces sp. MZ04 TaxID=2559236 RepID=UPI001FD83A6E|nr:SLC13 family permease [Streptomyces sp. MZ04]
MPVEDVLEPAGLVGEMDGRFNVGLCVVVCFVFGGRQLLGQCAPTHTGGTGSAGPAPGGEQDDGPPGGQLVEAGGTSGPALAIAKNTATATADTPPVRLDGPRTLTLLGLLSLVGGALFFDLDVGLMALSITVVLSLVSPKSAKGAVERCAWSTVLLVCGIVTYVSQMERMGTIDYLGKEVASIQAPLVGALLICLIGAVVSAFASTTGMLGALIPLAVPFLLDGQVGAVGLITALAISASVVDASPFSTSGALVTANTPEEQRDFVFRRLTAWGLGIAVVAPLVTWGLFVVPGSL